MKTSDRFYLRPQHNHKIMNQQYYTQSKQSIIRWATEITIKKTTLQSLAKQ